MYQVNPDGTVTFVKNTREAAENAQNWKDYSKDLNQGENA